MSTSGQSGGVAHYFSRLGPTWLAGAIAAGPATMASVLVAGASFGYALLWVVIISALFGALAQYLSTRLALATGEGIVQTVENRYGSIWAWILVIDVVLAAGLAQLVIMKTLADVSALMSGFDARLWGVFWAIVLAVGLAGGGYRVAELGAKVIVSAVVLAFVASLFVVPIDLSTAATGLVPSIPAGVSGALIAAGVLGGAVHITIITMQTYTVRARGWDDSDRSLARFDIFASMIVAFGLFSLATFLVAAGALHGTVDAAGLDAIAAAAALEPIAGTYAQWLFLIGLLGAAVSTLGGNTIVPPFLVADKLGWDTDVSDRRYRTLLAATALLSAGGAFIEGSFFQLLVLVLAFGLVGTPFAIAIVVLLVNDRSVVDETPGFALNVGAVALFSVTTVLAGSFVQDEIASGLDPLTLFVVAFAVAMSIATVALLGSQFVSKLSQKETPAESQL
ncbi:NRAMP family divalent metal transporter [Natronocalculus amylovorans]|uniref:Divalent metal cation transporter n=1 Tax=Natronocalculus amylovorans TaxID=2917812 RepID=A0AAE3FY18_9EURY|nr:divalent metal cation transporter [Natronocalculus amylovorans]MCL9817113.1 divalent metal cation transporter [Natronocalculus amylovorans]NUE02860.1 divalent metal cation transporter [Halorubraceae archaeon YAN]